MPGAALVAVLVAVAAIRASIKADTSSGLA
jgi:hypothetical protein